MKTDLTAGTAFVAIPIAGGASIFVICRVGSLSPAMSLLISAFAATYFSWTATRLHWMSFREERLGVRLPTSARWEFLGGFSRFVAFQIAATAGTFVFAALSSSRVGIRVAAAFLMATACHLILPWVFVLSADNHRRGRRLLAYDEANIIAQKSLTAGDPGILWGGIYHPIKELSQSHFLTVGVTRSGKTLTIRLFMQSLLPLIGMPEDNKPPLHRGTRYRALVYDAKADFLPLLAALATCKVVALNPFDVRGHAWRIRDDVPNATVALELASALLPEKKESNPFFTQAGRALIAGIMTSFVEAKGKWRFLDVLIAARTPETMRAVLQYHQHTSHLVSKYFEPPETFGNILATMSNDLTILEPVAHLWAKAETQGKTVSLKEWVEGDFILLLGNDDSLRVPIDAINRALFTRLSQLLLRPGKPTNERSLLILDELREAGDFGGGLRRLLNKGLSEGTTVIAGFQDVEGMREAYGTQTGNELIGMFSNKAILRLESPQAAEWAASTFGEFERYEYSATDTSDGKKKQEQIAKRESLLPSQFLSTPPTDPANGLTGYFISPAIGAYRANIPWEFIRERLIDPKPEKEVPRFKKRKNIPFVASWTKEDLDRLNMPDLFTRKHSRSDPTVSDGNDQGSGKTELPAVQVLRRRTASS